MYYDKNNIPIKWDAFHWKYKCKKEVPVTIFEPGDEYIYKVKDINDISNICIRRELKQYEELPEGGYTKFGDMFKYIYYYFDEDGKYTGTRFLANLRFVTTEEWVEDVRRPADTKVFLQGIHLECRKLFNLVLVHYMIPDKTDIEDFEFLLNYFSCAVYGEKGYPLRYEKMANKRKRKLPWPDSLDRDVTKIEKPIYRNTNGNVKKAFDYIIVDCNIRTNIEDKKAFLKKNIRDISKMVIDHIENDRSFKKYNVPIGVLKLSKIYRIEEATIEFIFELKDKLREMEVQNG